jgi:hypothetical protein
VITAGGIGEGFLCMDGNDIGDGDLVLVGGE